MMLRNIFQRILTFLAAGPTTGGLEIGDNTLRFVGSDAGTSLTAMVRLAPDIFEAGKIKDVAAFRTALRMLRSEILGKKAGRAVPVNVVVSLSSINIYSQVFALPVLDGENLERAVELNIKMALPSGTAETYSGWQTLSSAADSKIEVLSAFFDKSLADDLTDVLRKERFSPLAIEPRSLSLARLVKAAGGGFDTRAPMIFVSADTSGLDVSIVRGGNLHFDYFHAWRDLQGDERQMTMEAFGTAVVRSVSQIINFYNSHWQEPLQGIFIAATGLEDQIIEAVRENFDIKVSQFAPRTDAISGPEWFVAWGAALRGRTPRRDDRELSLLGVGAQALFRQEQVEHFLRFWRLLVPLALCVLVLASLGARLFAGQVKRSVESQAMFNLGPDEARQAADLKKAAMDFNTALGYIIAADSGMYPKSPVLQKIFDITNRRGITVYRMTVADAASPVTLSGSAPSEESVRELKNELEITPGIRDVNLPLTDIRKEGEAYIFSISFFASSETTR